MAKRDTGRPHLPPEFAENLIHKEMQLDKQVTSELINELAVLYGQAIEYYEDLKDPKYMDYQERMQKMFMKPGVMQAMQQQRPIKKSNSITVTPPEQNIEERAKEYAENRRKRATEFQNSMKGREEETQAMNANQIFLSTDHSAKASATRARNDKRTQDDSITARLQQRKASRSPVPNVRRSRSFVGSIKQAIQGVPEAPPDSSAGPAKPANRRVSVESEMVGVMERWFAIKASKISDIKLKYQQQIAEIQRESSFGPDSPLQLVVDQLKKTMDDEIESVSQEIDEKRKAEVAQVRANYVKVNP